MWADAFFTQKITSLRSKSKFIKVINNLFATTKNNAWLLASLSLIQTTNSFGC